MNIGKRIYYNQDGVILFASSEIENGTPRPEYEEVFWIDLDYGSIDYKKKALDSIDVARMVPVLIDLDYETPEQKRIRELEDLLLLQLENELGGIL